MASHRTGFSASNKCSHLAADGSVTGDSKSDREPASIIRSRSCPPPAVGEGVSGAVRVDVRHAMSSRPAGVSSCLTRPRRSEGLRFSRRRRCRFGLANKCIGVDILTAILCADGRTPLEPALAAPSRNVGGAVDTEGRPVRGGPDSAGDDAELPTELGARLLPVLGWK